MSDPQKQGQKSSEAPQQPQEAPQDQPQEPPAPQEQEGPQEQPQGPSHEELQQPERQETQPVLPDLYEWFSTTRTGSQESSITSQQVLPPQSEPQTVVRKPSPMTSESHEPQEPLHMEPPPQSSHTQPQPSHVKSELSQLQQRSSLRVKSSSKLHNRVQWEMESADSTIDEDRDSAMRREASNRFMPGRVFSKVFRKGLVQSEDTEEKLGWIQGVFLNCLLNICSASLFLRLPWMVGQAGILYSLSIVGSSAAVCFISTLSMCAIFTNGIVGKGGVYYTISRSLGAELGASVGVIFAFANALSCSVNAVGFCDSFINFLHKYHVPVMHHEHSHLVWVAGTLFLIVVAVICAAGLDFQNKAQSCLLGVVMVAVTVFVISALVGPTNDTERARGFVGMSTRLFHRNLYSDFRPTKDESYNWISVFAVFFPTVTNVHTGANIATELKDPVTAIPKGSILAAGVSMILYAVMVLVCGASAVRDASGNVADLKYFKDGSLDYDLLAACAKTAAGCPHGLHNDFNVIMLMSLWDFVIYLGCWAATFSSVMTNLFAVPRLLEALGLDEIYPGMRFFAKPYGRHKEPYRGYVLTLIVSILFMLLADINTISPLTTSFFLAAYALINFCTFHAASVNPIGWRPTFRYYNIYVSLLGSVLCLGIMLVISWMMFIITSILFFFLYLYVHYRSPKVNWGSSTQAQAYKSALSSVYTLARTGEHVKNYWPQLLVLTGKPSNRPILAALAHLITMGGSLMICGEVVKEHISNSERLRRLQESYQWLRERKIRSFCSMVTEFNFYGGVRALIQSAGVGRLSPNIILLGYKNDWHSSSCAALVEYFNVLHMAFETGLAVTMLRVEGGLDWEEHKSGLHTPSLNSNSKHKSSLDGSCEHKLNEQRRSLNEQQTSGNEQQTSGSEQQRTEIEQRTSGNEQRTSLSEQRTSGNEQQRTEIEQRTSGNEQQTSLSEQQTSGNEQHTSGSEQQTSGSEQRTSGEEQRTSVSEPGERQGSDQKTSLHRTAAHSVMFQGDEKEHETKEQAEHKAKIRAINIRRKRRAYMMTFEYPGYLLEGAGDIDVWWLYHDGGLTMLIPYIISERSTWSDTKLRIFSICNDPTNVDAERESMATLLAKFRISYSSLEILDDTCKSAASNTVEEFNKLIDKFRKSDNEACQITDDMLSSMAEKTARQLRLHELMRKHSPHARLIVMSLPMPRRGEVAPPLYMAWLEMLSKDLPPLLFVRGNKTKVLTYYL